jgi:hypothetical protein
MIFKEHIIISENLMHITKIHLGTWYMQDIFELKGPYGIINRGISNMANFHTCSIGCMNSVLTLVLITSG